MVSARRDKMKEKTKEYLQFMNEKIYSQLSYAEAKHAVLIRQIKKSKSRSKSRNLEREF